MKCTGFSQDGSPRPAENIIHNVVKKGSMLTDRVRSCNATVIATSGKLLGRNDWEIDTRASIESRKLRKRNHGIALQLAPTSPTWGICTRRAGKLKRARSRLYRSQILFRTSEVLQENMRWKALAEIYKMHSFASFSNLNFFVKNC